MTDYPMEVLFEGRRHYVAGERVACNVALKCPQEMIDSGQSEMVAIHAVAVQIVGIFSYNEQWCSLPYVAPAKKNHGELFPPVLYNLGLCFKSCRLLLF